MQGLASSAPGQSHRLFGLAKRGTHGTSVPGVGRTLIEEGARAGIKEEFPTLRDDTQQPS